MARFKLLPLIFYVVAILAAIGEIIFFPDETNVMCVMIATSAFCLVIFIILRPKAFQFYSLSALQVLFFAGALLLIPLIGTLIEGKPLIYNLQTPIETFGYTALAALTLALAHAAYQAIGPIHEARRVISETALRELFRPPTDMQLWLMGLGGSMAMLVRYLLIPDTASGGEGGLAARVLTGLAIFTYAPYVIPFGSLYGRRGKVSKQTLILILLYFFITLALAMGRNSRGAFAIAIMTVLVCFGLAILTQRISESILLKVHFWIPITIVGLVAVSVLSDLALAMQAVRSEKRTSGAGEMIELSVEMLFNRKALSDFEERLGAVRRAEAWDDRYISNPFLKRLCSIKYHDIQMNMALKLGEAKKKRLADYTIARTWAILPGPVLGILGVHINKDALISFSGGDYMGYLYTGVLFAQFATGSIVASGIAIYGGWFFILFGLLAMLIFGITDCLCRPITEPVNGKLKWLPQISAVALLNIYLIMVAFRAESIADLLSYPLRDIPQMVVLYWIAFKFTGLFSMPVKFIGITDRGMAVPNSPGRH